MNTAFGTSEHEKEYNKKMREFVAKNPDLTLNDLITACASAYLGHDPLIDVLPKSSDKKD